MTMTSLVTAFIRIISFLKTKNKGEGNDNISLEALNNRIRLFVWFFLATHITINTFLSPTRLALWIYITVYSVMFGFLYVLVKCKNEMIKGLPFLILNLGATLAIVQKGEDYYLRIITVSLPSLPIFSVQGYPPVLLLAMGAGHFWIYKNYHDYIDTFFEPITSTYSIPAVSIESTLNGWRIGLVFEIVCLMTYQIVVQRLWRNYQKAKRNLEETNQKLQKVNLQLAQNVEELARLNAQLHDVLQSQDMFVACVSHELRNPLNVMLGSLDLLESHIKEKDQVQILKTCRVCGDALLSQINNLLDVAKINADKLEISEFATNMGGFLERFWAYTRISLEKKGLSGYLSVDRHLPLWLNIDEHRLQQILNNLIGNAIKFTTEGSVRVKVQWLKGNDILSSTSVEERTKRDNQVTSLENISEEGSSLEMSDIFEGERHDTYNSTILHRKDVIDDFLYFKPQQTVKSTLESSLATSDNTKDNMLRVDIVDTGCGISEEVQQKVFEPFVQGDRSVTRKYGGTGLGLYIVKSLVTKMGGTIKITSLKDVGTHFQIVLPAKSVAKECPNLVNKESSFSMKALSDLSPRECQPNGLAKTREASLPTIGGLKKKALIVDDDMFNQNLLREYFKKLDFESDVASNGVEALQIYKNNNQKYTVMTMDIQMPIMDGITACKQIRAYEDKIGKSRIPIIITTGNCSEAEQRACLLNKEIGATFFFRKPFGLKDCKLCVEKILNGLTS